MKLLCFMLFWGLICLSGNPGHIREAKPKDMLQTVSAMQQKFVKAALSSQDMQYVAATEDDDDITIGRKHIVLSNIFLVLTITSWFIYTDRDFNRGLTHIGRRFWICYEKFILQRALRI